jgi:hypothetical protein
MATSRIGKHETYGELEMKYIVYNKTSCQRPYLLQLDASNSNQRSQYGSGDGRTLNQNSNGSSDKNGNQSVDIGGLVNDTSGHSHKSTLQHIHQSDQANNQQSERQDEADSSRDVIVLFGGSVLEECRALKEEEE